MRKVAFFILAIIILVACDRIDFYLEEWRAIENFKIHEAEFIAFGKALSAHADVRGATNCDKDDCWRIGRNFPYFEGGGALTDNESFAPHLNNIGLTGYIFFQRNENGDVILPDYYGGRTGDFSLTQYYAYEPASNKSFSDCENYTPPTEDFYDCSMELGHGWALRKTGLNNVKLRKCSEQIFDCKMEGGTQKSCTPAECAELVPDW